MCAIATPDDPYALQMLLLDEEGTLIEGTVQKPNMQRNGFSEYLLDFMGILTTISEEITVVKGGMQKRLVLLDFVDEMGEVRFAVFGDMVDVVLDFLSQPSLAVHEIETNVEVSVITPRTRPISARDEFLNLYPKKRVGELYELLEDWFVYFFVIIDDIVMGPFMFGLVQEGSFIIIGTIMEVVHDGQWWYMACSCMRAINYGRGMPFCDECKTIVYDLTPRYKIKVTVSDGSDNAHLIMWDIKDDDNENLDDSFKVKSVCTDSIIINEYKEDVDDETPLKLKFVPAFSEMVDNEKSSCVIDISPHSSSAITEVDVTPKSCALSSSAVETSLVLSKRDVETSVDATQGRTKKGKLRNMKLE
ncbi:Nucleic acid-binding, OB-fold [Sesbania bispinosa]|nr:Nucleic acid-binding, OB-fold [Sesbania bispinosa]